MGLRARLRREHTSSVSSLHTVSKATLELWGAAALGSVSVQRTRKVDQVGVPATFPGAPGALGAPSTTEPRLLTIYINASQEDLI